MPFNNYNGVEQTSTNSCGAFALAAALDHIGHANYTNILDTANLANGFTAAGPAAFAQSIYQITGCLNLGLNTATYQYEAPVEDMNPPSALAYMAVQHGANPANIMTRYNNAAMATFQAMNVTNPGGAPDLLNTEIGLINPPALGNIVGPTDYIALPVGGQAQLLLVNDNAHWIAINSFQVYDPGTGFVGPYAADPGFTAFTYVFNGAPRSYTFSGLWIQLS